MHTHIHTYQNKKHKNKKKHSWDNWGNLTMDLVSDSFENLLTLVCMRMAWVHELEHHA